MDNLYLDNLDEYINDENKIVTYRWLSLTLSVHANQAKQMLYTFVQKQRNEKHNDCLCVTYFVSGVTGEGRDQIQHACIVPENRLSAAKSRFHPITSCHVYSVSKSKVKDAATLCNADYDIIKENVMQTNKFSAIKCKQAQIRSSEDLEALRKHAQPTSEAPSFTRPKSEPTSGVKKQGGIAGMFASGVNKKTEAKTVPSPQQAVTEKNTETPTENKTNATGKKQSKGAIANFFANQATKPKKAKVNEEENKEKSLNNKAASKPKQTTPKQDTTAKKKRAESDDDEPQQKKRRRIKAVISDSSEDEESEIEMEKEPTPPPTPPPSPKEPTPEPEPQPSPEKSPQKLQDKKSSPQDVKNNSSTNGEKRRKRQKKLVSKSFVDEDGFMVTEKVMETDSETDDEDIIPPTPPVKPAQKTSNTVQVKKSPGKKKPSPGKKGTKQASLMSFFKKK